MASTVTLGELNKNSTVLSAIINSDFVSHTLQV